MNTPGREHKMGNHLWCVHITRQCLSRRQLISSCAVCWPVSLQDAYSTAGLSPPVSLPSALMLAATRQWMFSNRRSPCSSRSSLQSAVVRVLEVGLGLHVDQELLTDDGLFSIDAAVTWKGR